MPKHLTKDTNENTADETGITVIVCCYNSEKRLPTTIKHLALQQVPKHFNWEVIIIDNNSTDDTALTAQLEWNKYSITDVNFKVIAEKKPGRSHALHKGVLSSTYNYILSCDDDNWLANNYLLKAFEVMQCHPAVGAAGGRGIAVSEKEFPEWFERYQYGYAVGEQSGKHGYLPPKKYLWGAGLIFTKQLYIKSYSYLPSLLTGRSKDTLDSGEDVEFCMRLLLSGYQLYYDETLVYQHYISTNRLTSQYREKLFAGNSYEKRILDLYAKQIQIYQQSRFKNISLFIASLIRYLISKVTTKSRWSHLHEAEIIYLIIGIKLTKISDEVFKIKGLQVYLSKKGLANV